MVRTWHDRGEPVPVAVVVSVFDDVLASSVTEDGASDADLEMVRVRAGGAAFLPRPVCLSAVAPMLMEALGADLPDEGAVPPAAWGLFDRLTSDEPGEGPADAEQLRQWLRDALGAPATHEEVRDCVLHALVGVREAPAVVSERPAGSDDVHELEALPPAPSEEPLPVPEPAAEENVVTLPPERAAPERLVETDVMRARIQPRDLAPPTDLETAANLPAPLPDTLQPGLHDDDSALPTTIDAEPPSAVQAALQVGDDDDEHADPAGTTHQPTQPAHDPSRPVGRHGLVRPPRGVSVITAPAARRSARAATYGPDSILVPADQGRRWGWLVAGAVLAAAVYFLFFR
ncbi:MAG: hypothetical protein KC933_14475 [Myxococcales bacterium]|nr:hypothetical protein [Myxococcales bacterium]